MVNSEQKLGITRSARPIFQPVKTNTDILQKLTTEYTMEDNFDAYALFQYLLAKELATEGNKSPRLKIYDTISKFHLRRLGKLNLEICKRHLSIATIFDVVEFGKSRADSIFVSNRP